MSRLSTKQRKARRNGKLHGRVQYTGLLHFSGLLTEREQASFNTWGPYLSGASLIERHALVRGTKIPVSVWIENGQRRSVTLRAAPNSNAAKELIRAGYQPDWPSK